MDDLICTVVAGCLLSGTPAPITLDGRELSSAVEVWTLQDPAVPAAEAEEADDLSLSSRHPILTGALAGAAGGCVYGAAVGMTAPAITAKASCAAGALFWSGVVAGTVAFVRWYRAAAL